MSQFSTALRQCLDRTFGGKIIALASASGLPDPEIGRLLREQTPVTSAKLEKLLTAEGMTTDDRTLLVHSAVRDYVGEQEYAQRFAPKGSQQDDLGGVIFRSMFPLRPKAARTLKYLIQKAGADGDVATVLEIIGNMLELPEDDAPTGTDVEEAIDEATEEIRQAKKIAKKSGKSDKTA